MSHFFKVANAERISGEPVEIVVDKPYDLGLWGYLDFKGIEVDVRIDDTAPQASKNLVSVSKREIRGDSRIWRILAKGLNPSGTTVRLTAYNSENHLWDFVNLMIVPSATAGFRGDSDYRHPGNVGLNVSVYWTSRAPTGPVPDYTWKAEQLLAHHGLRLVIRTSVQKSAALSVDFAGEFTADHQATANAPGNGMQIRRLVQEKFAPPASQLVMIVCPFSGQSSGSLGSTFEPAMSPPFPSFCFLNSNFTGTDRATLLHEMGHAVGLDPTYPSIEPINFMCHGSPHARTGIRKDQLIALAGSFFAR